MKRHARGDNQAGYNIIEVVIGIAIFTIGLLALSALQGALTRSMADAKARTTATNLAEQFIERQRGFRQLTGGGGGTYSDIGDTTDSATVEGVTFSITQDVTDYYYDLATDAFTTTGSGTSDYKQVAVTVTWAGDREFRLQEGTETSGNLGSGSITVTSTIPAISTFNSGRVSTVSDDTLAAPDTAFTPGLAPEVIALSLGDSKFKESLTPQPQVIVADDKVETRFDVVTYSLSGGSVFLRREENRAVSCDCILKSASSSNPGLRPVVWAGDEWLRGHAVEKPYGIPATDTQSDLCDTCCRDHHDGGSSALDHADPAVDQYGPFKASGEYRGPGSFEGDHKHYKADGVTVAAADETYLEACRLVRVDGFLRVAQDFRREDEYVFPQDFLDEPEEVGLYSAYVTGAVSAFEAATSTNYENSPPCIGDDSCVASPAMQAAYPEAIATDIDGNPSEFPSWTKLPFGGLSAETQQLRSRGIYIDYISPDLRAVISCLEGGGDAGSCRTGDVILDRTGSVNTLEIIPFFDVQLTFLDRWNETPLNTPVNATNEALLTNNLHSRAAISRDDYGSSVLAAASHSGNLGFLDTPAIDPEYSDYARSGELTVHSLDEGGAGVGEGEPSGYVQVGGALSETVEGSPTIIVTGMNGVECGQTAAEWWCAVPEGASDPRIQISGFAKDGDNKPPRIACSEALTTITANTDPYAPVTVFSLAGLAAASNYDISILDNSCGGGDTGGGEGGDITVGGALLELVDGDPIINVSGLNGATCSATTTNWTCTVAAGSVDPQVVFSGFAKEGGDKPPRIACSGELTTVSADTTPEAPVTVFSLTGVAAGSNYTVTIKDNSC